MIRRILLATDGSSPAMAAEALAEYLAYALGAELVALYVKDTRLIRFPELLDLGALSVPLTVRHEEIEEALEARARGVLARLEASAKAAGVAFTPALRTGVPYRVIAEESRAADLVVMGRAGEAHGHEVTGVGSTVERVARVAPVPVLVTGLDYAKPERLLLGYDGSPSATRALHAVADLAEGLELPVGVVSVSEELEQAEALVQEAAGYLAARGVRVHTRAVGGDSGEQLIEMQQRVDLLAIGAFGRGRVRELLLGSTTELVLRRAIGPVLLVR